jgi:dinuclear metal center YbgI/SA1388 family protein
MPTARDVAEWLDRRLDAPRFREVEPENGLIVEASTSVRVVASSVNTTFASIAMAADAGADLLVVHHPTWPYIDLGLHERKLRAVRDANLSLYAAHASLDGADEGTGRALASLLGISVEGRFADYHGAAAGVYGTVAGGWTDLVERTTVRLGVAPDAHKGNAKCERIGIVTGAGGATNWLEEAYQLGCDTYLTGEGSMYTRLFAKEIGLNLVLAGHDATETPGIEALAEATAKQFGLRHTAVREPHIG